MNSFSSWVNTSLLTLCNEYLVAQENDSKHGNFSILGRLVRVLLVDISACI